MLVEMKSPAFMDHGQERHLTTFHGGLNVVLGEEDGAMSIGKSSSLLAIDFAFGGDTYIKSDGVRHEGHHTVFFAFEFKGVRHYFARNTSDGDTVFFCDKDYNLTGVKYTKEEFISWLRNQYGMEYEGVSFRTVLSSFFRIYGKGNTDELNPLKGIPGQNMEKSIATILTVFNRYGDIQEFRDSVTEHSKRLEAFRDARKYQFISDLVGGQKKYEENLAAIRDLELQLATLMEEAEQGHSEEEIELNKQKAALTSEKLNTENAIHTSLQRKSQAPNRTCCKKIWQKVGRKKCSTNKPPQSAGLKREKGSDVRGMLSGWREWDLLTGECPARQNNLAA